MIVKHNAELIARRLKEEIKKEVTEEEMNVSFFDEVKDIED